MPPRNWIMRIEDILDASRWIQNHTHGLDLDAFVTNRMATHAVLHNMGAIGEAARHVPLLIPRLLEILARERPPQT
jgi:uncharacterized protein with HEPN domain